VVPLAILAALLVGALLLATSGDDEPATTAGGVTDTTTAGPGEIFLEPAAAGGDDPFAPSVASAAPPVTVPPDTPVTLGTAPPGETAPTAPVFGTAPPGGGSGGTPAITARSGSTPGLYGGTRNQASCDQAAMVGFLAANLDKARAFAEAQAIGPAEVGAFVLGLTPALLRNDTRVTNHGFRDNRPTARQSVLQAGTAVMVDQRGVPRVRCACGNPLLPPEAAASTPTYQGTPWSGFSPTNVTVVSASPTVINVITLIDVTTGQPFGRPAGPAPGPDLDLPTLTTTTTTPPVTAPPSTAGVTTTLPVVTVPQPSTTRPPATTTPPVVTTTPPTTAPPTTVPSCPGTSGMLLERLTVDSARGSGPSSQTYPAGCGYRVVFSGDTDWNVNNAFQGGFDTHYCTDPQYCTGAVLYSDGGGFKINGGYVWVAFGTSPPPYSPSHVYTYTAASLPGNRLTTAVTDVAHQDNAGSFVVEIFRA